MLKVKGKSSLNFHYIVLHEHAIAARAGLRYHYHANDLVYL